MKKLELNPLQKAVAEKIHTQITESQKWIESQEKLITDVILGGPDNSYNLRQNCQALDSGHCAMSSLKAHFESFVGITHDRYCEGIEVAKVVTPEEKLLAAIKELMGK